MPIEIAFSLFRAKLYKVKYPKNMVSGHCPAGTEFCDFTKTSFELHRVYTLKKYGSQGCRVGHIFLAREKQSNWWRCMHPSKTFFRVKYLYGSSLLWHIKIFQQNLPKSKKYNKILQKGDIIWHSPFLKGNHSIYTECFIKNYKIFLTKPPQVYEIQ